MIPGVVIAHARSADPSDRPSDLWITPVRQPRSPSTTNRRVVSAPNRLQKMVDTTQFRIMHNSETEAMRTRFCDEPAEMFRGDAGTERGWT